MITAMLAFLVVLYTGAQGLLRNYLVVNYEKSTLEGRFRVTKITNYYTQTVEVTIINQYDTLNGIPKRQVVTIESGKSWGKDVTCNILRAKSKGAKGKETDTTLREIDKNTKEEKVKDWNKKPTPPKPVVPTPPTPAKPTTEEPIAKNPVTKDTAAKNPIANKKIPADTILSLFYAYIDSIPFLSLQAIKSDSDSIQNHINTLRRDYVDNEAYAKQNGLMTYVKTLNDSIEQYNSIQKEIVNTFLSRYDTALIEQYGAFVDSINNLMAKRINARHSLVKQLETEITPAIVKPTPRINWKYVAIGAGLIAIFALIFLWYKKASKKPSGQSSNSPSVGRSTLQPTPTTDDASIVVVNPTRTVVMKKLDISDVTDNDAYLKIDASEFCADSAVRTMYLKNSCIKDIYNMYADDLRDPSKMNEDGCMVIGRWVRDDDTGLYDVTLEEIVRPGDDAVFSEYELNFGGKIKLKLADRLRRLRRDTDLQYDLTCWVHSHPGLGVFFSSSDNNVQQQLRRPTHPEALTAMVIDILTPEQELGIFTFKTDGTLNAKGDLTKMYSLEEIYRWAVESSRHAIKADDYFNTLSQTMKHLDACNSVHLSNGAVIDMALLATEKKAGFAATVYGFTMEKDGRRACIVNKVASTTDSTPTDDEAIGCFIMASHFSLPSVRKALATLTKNAHFVIVYAATDEVLTTIPVEDGKLCDDENYYGEQQLEDLKSWTKRRR